MKSAVRLIVASALLGAFHATSVWADEGPAPAKQDQIVSQTASWGKPVSGWGVNSDGSGWVMSTRQGATFTEYTAITRRWAPVPGRYEEVKQSLNEAERYAGRKIPCTLAYTDGPYGSVTWTRKGKSKVLPVQCGCTSPIADRIYDSLDKVRANLDAWAEGAPASEEHISRR